MDCGKYIIKVVRGVEVAIIFDGLISHCDIGTKGDSRGETVAAGFFAAGAKASEHDPKDISISVWGKSVTLGNLWCRKDIDEALIKKVLRKDY